MKEHFGSLQSDIERNRGASLGEKKGLDFLTLFFAQSDPNPSKTQDTINTNLNTTIAGIEGVRFKNEAKPT